MKGNNGGARRRRRLVQFTVRVGVVGFILVLVVFIFGKKKGPKTHKTRHHYGWRQQNAGVKEPSSTTRHNHLHKTNDETTIPSQAEESVLRAEWHLINIHIPQGSLSSSTYHGVKGLFCPLNWSLYQTHPYRAPFFKDLVAKSPHCQENQISVDLKHLVEKAHQVDNSTSTLSLPPSGFIFHQSRCGSTLISNVLAGAWPSTNRVYSEAAPLIHALQACEVMNNDKKSTTSESSFCNPLAVEELVRDVVYLLGRIPHDGNDSFPRRLFFKIQSIGTKNGLQILSRLYPTTPWIFVYRHPIQVMMSYFDSTSSSSVCTRGHLEMKRDLHANAELKQLIVESIQELESITKQEYCAATLAFYCNAALEQQSQTGMGRMVNYNTIKTGLLNDILVEYFGLTVNDTVVQEANRILGFYSKQAKQQLHEWVQDSDEKEEAATEQVTKACEQFLWKPYNELERLATSD